MRSPDRKAWQLPDFVAFYILLILLLLLSPTPLLASEWEPAEESVSGLHAQCWSLGASVGRVERLNGGLAELAGPDDEVIIIEGIQSDYLTPYTSEQYQVSLNLMNNMTLLQAAYGMRISTVPFPKVFLRPWIGAYLTLNLLEDHRDVNAGNDEFEGGGIGLAASAGVTMKLSQWAALEMAVRGDQIFMLGQLESGDFFSDAFRMRGLYLRLVYLFQTQE
ncbi:hypothetical protein MUP29_09285 [bacterium]|nr:hypothetical protein [bacterium]